MRHNPKHAVTDEQVVRRLIAENPWATIVSHNGGELVASHYPVLLDEEADGLAVVTHVGRPDERVHDLGSGEVLLIVAGPHGYISPSWYSERRHAGAHLELQRGPLLRHAADPRARREPARADAAGRPLRAPRGLARAAGPRGGRPAGARARSGLRLPIDRFVCKVKMSQDKDEQSRRRVLEELRGDGPYAQPRWPPTWSGRWGSRLALPAQLGARGADRRQQRAQRRPLGVGRRGWRRRSCAPAGPRRCSRTATPGWPSAPTSSGSSITAWPAATSSRLITLSLVRWRMSGSKPPSWRQVRCTTCSQPAPG